jgi:hypothetical protein
MALFKRKLHFSPSLNLAGQITLKIYSLQSKKHSLASMLNPTLMEMADIVSAITKDVLDDDLFCC